MFDDNDYGGSSSLTEERKVSHYQHVLSPRPEDVGFLRSLPAPRPFGDFLARQRAYLERFPLALIGEVGLDRSFRIPESWLPEQADERDDALTPGGREGRRLSPYRVSLDHQKKVLLAQLHLAGELQRAVSVHGVQAHGAVHDTLAETWKGHKKQSNKDKKRQEAVARAHAEPADDTDEDRGTSQAKPYPPRVCLHSFSGPAETVKQYVASSVPCDVFFSFSTTINAWSEDGKGKVEAAVRAVPDDRLLVESDLHTAGDSMDGFLEAIVRKLCEIKGWGLEEGVTQLGKNWKRFAFGLVE